MGFEMRLELFVSVLLFCASLMIFFIVRASDMKKRSIQNVQSMIKSFRNESAATKQQLLESTQNCIDKVQELLDRAERTGDMINSLFVSLESHSKDLTALEGVCVNYKRALEKLRVQTEQAESRISVVREEVHKAEMINDSVKSFKNDMELIIREIDEKKGEFASLVTSTSESLKRQAESELEENARALGEFAGTLEKERTSFVAFISDEKEALNEKSLAEREALSRVDGRLDQFDQEVSDVLLKAERRLDELKKEYIAYIEKIKEELDLAQKRMGESFEKMSGSIESSSSFLEMRKSDIEKELDEKEVKLKESLEKRKEELSSGLSEKAEEIGNGLADYLPKLDETKDRVIAEARKTMDEGIGESSRASKALVEELEKSIGNALSSLDDATHELEGKINDAVGIGVRKVGEASDRLKELEEKIKASESILLSLQSRITKTREAIYNSHESQRDDHGRKEDEISDEKKEMFSSFPDDIILGDEDEIDLSDDE